MIAQRTAMTQALVLNKVKEIELRDIDVHEPFTADDLRIDICSVGICGSDLHYYQVCVSLSSCVINHLCCFMVVVASMAILDPFTSRSP
jgi:threonine dehydrogenase-like Zn-dependent dehydrogenase